MEVHNIDFKSLPFPYFESQREELLRYREMAVQKEMIIRERKLFLNNQLREYVNNRLTCKKQQKYKQSIVNDKGSLIKSSPQGRVKCNLAAKWPTKDENLTGNVPVTIKPLSLETNNPSSLATTTLSSFATSELSSFARIIEPSSPPTTGPSSPANIKPLSPVTTGPSSPANIKPLSPVTTGPSSPVNIKLLSPVTTGPSSPVNIKLLSPVTTGPSSPANIKPLSPITIERLSLATNEPSSPATNEPSSPVTIEQLSLVTEPSSPTIIKPLSPTTIKPLSPTTIKPSSPAIIKPLSQPLTNPVLLMRSPQLANVSPQHLNIIPFSDKTLEHQPIEHKRRRSIRDVEDPIWLVTAVAKGFLTRRLLKTEKIQNIIKTIKDAENVLQSLNEPSTIQDFELQRRVITQLQTAKISLHEIFFIIPVNQRMSYISHSRMLREMKKFKKLEESNKKECRLSSATVKSLERRKATNVTVTPVAVNTTRKTKITKLNLRQTKPTSTVVNSNSKKQTSLKVQEKKLESKVIAADNKRPYRGTRIPVPTTKRNLPVKPVKKSIK